jgi:hypothetical protein
MTTPYVPAQYQEFVFLSPKQLQIILNISRSKCYAFLHDVYASKYPLFKVEYIGCSIRVQARSFWRWYSEGDPSLAEGF